MPLRPIPLIAGNWKMNGVTAALAEAEALATLVATHGVARGGEVALCPPATLLMAMRERLGRSGIATGGQDCHARASGAHTGDISAAMLKDAGARFVIVGHSERRADHGETDEAVREKAAAAVATDLIPIVCVGETESQRLSGEAVRVVERQLDGSIPDGVPTEGIVIAYEPVWAIGTGLTPTLADIAEMHEAIRRRLVERFGEGGHSVRILYGGSLKPGNAREILAVDNVDGGLVGGASLLAKDFFAIISAL
ncbi:triosephosphate isomerase [Devosia enhydra]|uniref:Triosephosphate isomerase n=1 Tax=Devosia enhydra TaxID=665118 RepID=A0A1K2HUK8_9HYPH|nr:triose-phosphate isomerase [Devosia enhydra]SFZ82163.1 triosephosphate isomerase [Devosia enhydra]